MNKLYNLLGGIEQRNLVLPEFQREYVWNLEQAKQLIVSLYNDYPIGALLFWNTNNPPEIKNFDLNKNQIGNLTVILDGQQRLTTLYLLIKNEIPPYYKKNDITQDPRHLYFNLQTKEFLYYKPSHMKNNPLWVKVTDCFSESLPINVFEISKKLLGDDHQKLFTVANELSQNLTTLKNILNKEFLVQYVPVDSAIDEAIDIFDRVNSLGTKLSDADLALTHITGKWPEARRILKEKISELEQKKYSFDLTFMTRCLVGIVKGRGLFETIHKSNKEEVQAGWKKLDKILDYLITILPKRAFIHSTEDVNTTNVFVPLIVYLSRKDNNTFSSIADLKQALRWIYLAHLWARYTGQTDQRLDYDINIVVRNHNPWDQLIKAIIEQRGRIKLECSDLEGRTIQHPIYKMMFIVFKSKDAIDWFNGSPLDETHGAKYLIQSHHIFPASRLWKTGKYNSKNVLHKLLVNDISNRAFITASTNLSEINNKLPEEYFKKIIDNFGEAALKKQLIPLERDLWKIENYELFLKRRRQMIVKEINNYLDSFIYEQVGEREINIKELLEIGESNTLEYKSSIRWDYNENRVNKDLEKVILKTICGFLNSQGGTLLIGIDDDGNVVGIENDLMTIQKKDKDGYFQLLINMIHNFIGAEFSQYIDIKFQKYNEKVICILNIDKSPQPVFLTENNNKIFYTRMGNTTRPLDAEEQHSYIQLHWQ
ncbi:MAG: DUF262 domain-containing protein [Caldisericia bacterium]|nr:DUF262 domain-containing protein [Caldisericia bacterium]